MDTGHTVRQDHTEARSTGAGKSRTRRRTVSKTIPPRIHRHTLIEMNKAVFTARRDAAHARAVALLRSRITGSTKERRSKQYTFCLRLIEDAITATQRSQIQQDSPVIHYLHLLRETVNANLALVNHEMTLVREASKFSRLVGAKKVEEFQVASDVFSQSEMNILQCIESLLKFGEPLLVRDRDERIAAFREDDRRRYELALHEYEEFYSTTRLELK